MASPQNPAGQSDSAAATLTDQGPPTAESNAGSLEVECAVHDQADKSLPVPLPVPVPAADQMTGQELCDSGELTLNLIEGEGKDPDGSCASRVLWVESVEDSAVIHSEMEFDPENTPRDPETEGCRTDIIRSASAEDLTTEQNDDSVSMEISLDTVPLEIVLHICEFLEAGVIINTLSKVCQAFHNLFTNEAYWRTRMAKRWPKKYPPVDCELLHNRFRFSKVMVQCCIVTESAFTYVTL